MTSSIRMEAAPSHMTEKILNLTLEIIYLLTGEGYVIVKATSGELLTHICSPNDPSSIKVPPNYSLTPERLHVKEISKVIKKMMELLTGEGWWYLEDSKDDVKDVKREDHQTFTSPDGSSNGNPPERCPPPLHSHRDPTQEDPTIPHHDQVDHTIPHHDQVDHTIPHHDQCEKEIDLKNEIKEEEEPVREDHQSMEEEEKKMIVTMRGEDSSLCTSTDGSSNGNPPERCPRPLYSHQDPTPEDLTIPHNHQCEKEMDVKLEVKEEEKELVRNDQQSMEEEEEEEEKMVVIMTGEESSLCTNTANDLEVATARHSPGADLGSHKKRSQGLSIPQKPNVDNLKRVSDRSENVFRCSECDQTFTTKSSFGRHKKTHSQKLFSCAECGTSFLSKSCFLRHQRHHTDVRPHPCTICGKSFKEKSVLVQHLRSHSGERPFACTMCDQRFIQKAHLGRHLRVHTGETPFSCKQCGRGFPRKDMLSLHEQRHVNERPFCCPECGKRFRQQFCLVRHQKLHDKKSSCQALSQQDLNLVHVKLEVQTS